MSEGQDPDIFITEVYYLKDELVYMEDVFNDDSILDMVLKGFTGEYLQTQCTGEADDDFTLHQAVQTMRNTYANRVMRTGPSRKEKGRESAILITSTPSAVVACSRCKTTGCPFNVERKTSPTALKVHRVACITQIATILAAGGLKSGTTTKPFTFVPVNTVAGLISTGALTPTPQQLRVQQFNWKLTTQ